MLLNLFPANKTIFMCLFLFLSIFFKYSLKIPLPTSNNRLILAFPIAIDAKRTVANERRGTLLVAPDKKLLSKISSDVIYLSSIFLNFSPSLISAMKKLSVTWFYWAWIAYRIYLCMIFFFWATYLWFTHAYILFQKKKKKDRILLLFIKLKNPM